MRRKNLTQKNIFSVNTNTNIPRIMSSKPCNGPLKNFYYIFECQSTGFRTRDFAKVVRNEKGREMGDVHNIHIFQVSCKSKQASEVFVAEVIRDRNSRASPFIKQTGQKPHVTGYMSSRSQLETTRVQHAPRKTSVNN
jgi:hypothetical protein